MHDQDRKESQAAELRGFKKYKLEKKVKKDDEDEEYNHGKEIDYSTNQFASNQFQKEYHKPKKSGEQKKNSFRQNLLKKRKQNILVEDEQQSTEFMSLLNTDAANSDPSKVSDPIPKEKTEKQTLINIERSKENEMATEKQ